MLHRPGWQHAAAQRHGGSSYSLLCQATRRASPRRRAPAPPLASSVRTPKDPKAFASMDEARAFLHTQHRGSAGLSGLLNWLGSSALYRTLIGALRRPTTSASSDSNKGAMMKGPSAGSTPLPPELAAQMASLMCCSEAAVQRLAAANPQLLQLGVAELLQRLMLLKRLLPTCDVAELVKQQPRLLLQGSVQALEQQVGGAVQLLRHGLAGADVDEMVMQDPDLLFLPGADVERGIARLHELWQVDEDALRNSDPAEIALAVRALAFRAPQRM